MKRKLALFFIALVSSFVAVQPAFVAEHNYQGIPQKSEKVAQGLVGHIGVAAQEIGSEKSITVNGVETFVMASTYKVAIAVKLLDLVDKGQLKLTDLIDLPPEMMVAGNNAIAERYIHPGIKLSVANKNPRSKLRGIFRSRTDSNHHQKQRQSKDTLNLLI